MARVARVVVPGELGKSPPLVTPKSDEGGLAREFLQARNGSGAFGLAARVRG